MLEQRGTADAREYSIALDTPERRNIDSLTFP